MTGGLAIPKSIDQIIKITDTSLILRRFLRMTESSEKIIKLSGTSVVVVKRFIINRRVDGHGSETGGATRDGIGIEEIREGSGILIGRAKGSGM